MAIQPGGAVGGQRSLGYRAMNVMKPVLKRLHSPDAVDLTTFTPEDPSSFGVLLQAMFGPEGSEGEESFDVLLCTPTWLARKVEREGPIDGRHHLIVDKFDLAQVRSYFTAYATSCTGKTWPEVATKLSRLGKWEFEDYTP